jgi:hypothetical protein
MSEKIEHPPLHEKFTLDSEKADQWASNLINNILNGDNENGTDKKD